MIPLIGSLGTPELLIILAVLVLLFGASKLPDLARGSGRAIRIFKSETKGLLDDDDDKDEAEVNGEAKTPEQLQIDATDEQTSERLEGKRHTNPTD